MRVNLILDVTIFFLFLIGFEPHLTGNNIHEWLNLFFAIAIIAHLAMHWDWTAAVLGQKVNRMSRTLRINSVVDMLLAFTFVALILSGLMNSRSILGVSDAQVPRHSIWHEIHSVFGNFLLFLVGVHFALHWKWLACAWTRYLGATLNGWLRPPQQNRMNHCR